MKINYVLHLLLIIFKNVFDRNNNSYYLSDKNLEPLSDSEALEGLLKDLGHFCSSQKVCPA